MAAKKWDEESARVKTPEGYNDVPKDNGDPTDYNFIHTPTPRNVGAALKLNKNAISPATEAYMRAQGLWDDKTDKYLEESGIRPKSPDIEEGLNAPVYDEKPSLLKNKPETATLAVNGQRRLEYLRPANEKRLPAQIMDVAGMSTPMIDTEGKVKIVPNQSLDEYIKQGWTKYDDAPIVNGQRPSNIFGATMTDNKPISNEEIDKNPDAYIPSASGQPANSPIGFGSPTPLVPDLQTTTPYSPLNFLSTDSSPDTEQKSNLYHEPRKAITIPEQTLTSPPAPAQDIASAKTDLTKPASGGGFPSLASIHKQDIYGGSPYSAEGTATIEEEQLKAHQDAMKAQQNVADVAKQTLANQGYYIQQMHADQDKREFAKQQAQKTAMDNDALITADIQDKVSKIKEVDPDRRSVGMKVLGAVAMGLGAFGASMTHNKNFAMDIIQNAIQADVKAQESNIEKQWKQVSAAKGFQNDQRVRDAFFIEQHSRAEQLAHEKYSDLINFEASKSGNAEVLARAADMNAKLGDGIAAIRQGRVDRATNFQLTEREGAISSSQAGSGRTAKMEKAHQELVEKALAAGYDPDQATAIADREVLGSTAAVPGSNAGGGIIAPKDRDRTVMVSGKPSLAVNKEAADMWRKFDPSYREVQQQANILEKALKERNTEVYTAARARLMEMVPRMYEYARGPSAGQLGGTEGREGTISTQIPEFPTRIPFDTGAFWSWSDRAASQVDQFKQHIARIGNDVSSATFGGGITPGKPSMPGR